jgi:anti-sigma B factor antagonist
MAIQNWSDKITVVELSDDPQFSDELGALMESYEDKPSDVVLDMSGVGFINSSNLSKLLRLRKLILSHHRKLILCAVTTQVWGVFLVTGLEKIFEFIKDMSTALATLQLDQGNGKGRKA